MFDMNDFRVLGLILASAVIMMTASLLFGTGFRFIATMVGGNASYEMGMLTLVLIAMLIVSILIFKFLNERIVLGKETKKQEQ